MSIYSDWTAKRNAYIQARIGSPPQVGPVGASAMDGYAVNQAELDADRAYQERWAAEAARWRDALSPADRADYDAHMAGHNESIGKAGKIVKVGALGTIAAAGLGAGLTAGGVLGGGASGGGFIGEGALSGIPAWDTAGAVNLGAAGATPADMLMGATATQAGGLPASAGVVGAAAPAVSGGSSLAGQLTSALTGQLGKSLLPVVGAALAGAAIGSSGGGAPGADPSTSSAIKANQGLASEQAAFSRDQWNEQIAYLAKLSPLFAEYQRSNTANLAAIDKQNAQQFSDYSTLYRPVQEAYIGDVMRAGSPEEQAAAAARAGAGVQGQIDRQREIDLRALASMGVTPDAGRSARTDSVLAAAARAGAENSARLGERDRGTGLKAQATGLGLNLAGVAQQGVQVANQTAGTGASVASVPFNLKQSADTQRQAGIGSAAAINTAAGQLGVEASRVNAAGWLAKQGVTNQNLAGLGSLAGLLLTNRGG